MINNFVSFRDMSISKVGIDIIGKYEPEEKLKDYINKRWIKYSKKFPKSFDGPLGRLIGWNISNKGLQLKIELTNFSSYIASRSSNYARIFSDDSRANPIGMTIIALTSDNQIVVCRRSTHADQNPGKLYFIGGYLDPGSTKNKKKILLCSIEKEVYEELNVSRVLIKSLTLNGLAYNKKYHHPELFITAKLSVSSQVIEKIWRSGKDSEESDNVFFYEKALLIKNFRQNTLPYKPTWSFSTGMRYVVSKSNF